MDINTILTLSEVGWIGLAKIAIIFVLFAVILFLSKKYFDSETYADIKAKIMSFEVKAEIDHPGSKRGVEKMTFVENLAMSNLSDVELGLVKKKGGIKNIAEFVLPVVKLALPMVFKVKK